MKRTHEYRMKFDEQARKLVAQMTLEEKIYMMSGHSQPSASMGGGGYNLEPYPFGGCKRLGIPELYFCDGPRGCVSGSSTCFPVPMARGASFDPELEYQIGRAIGKEVLGNGGNYFGGVCMNIPYHPGAGRSQECYGEDSYHMGEMASALALGVQEENVIACAKHFAFNSMERSRFKVNVTMDERTEKEVYLPHFQKVINRGAASVMNAYNLYQGQKCGHNPYLLREVLKKEWDFDGFVISDFAFGVSSAGGGISGGCDVEMHLCMTYTEKNVKKALEKGEITEAMLDEACLRITRTTLAFEKARKAEIPHGKEVLAGKDHISLARRAAAESITLLRNESQILPLKESMKLALIGDLANTENIGDHGSSKVRPPYITTLVQAIEKEYVHVKAKYVPTKKIRKEREAIQSADCAVIVCGMNHGDEGEYLWTHGGDRSSLELHKKDLKMIEQVSELNPNTIVVLMGGNVILTNSWKDKVKAILFAYYPGMEGGSALADILFGKVNPSGKLPFIIAQKESDYPQIKWNTKAQHYDYYHGYHKLDKENKRCDYPFGFGLSYTQFVLGEAEVVEDAGDTIQISAVVKNTGERYGAEVVQVYVSYPESKIEHPRTTLCGFQKVFLEAKEEKRVMITVNKNDLKYYDVSCKQYALDPNYRFYIGTNQKAIVPVTFSDTPVV